MFQGQTGWSQPEWSGAVGPGPQKETILLKLGAIQRVLPTPSAHVGFEQYARAKATPTLRAVAQLFERRFGIRFDTFTFFSGDVLSELHRQADLPTEVPENVQVVSLRDRSISPLIATLTEVANSKEISTEQRRLYYTTLLAIYHKLLVNPHQVCSDRDTFVVGIEREGRIWAESLGCLPPGRSLRPHAKRICFNGGIAVGVSKIPSLLKYSKCIIIDGAIASGATMIALIEKLRGSMGSFHVYSAHGPYEGLRAIARYAVSEDLDLHLTVGHATLGLNDHYYATCPGQPDRVVVGDLGDTISPLLVPPDYAGSTDSRPKE
jgi:hypothetical protein